MIKNVLEYLEKSAEIYGDKVACADAESRLTYSELERKAKLVGSRLAKKVKPGTAISVYMDKSCDTLALFMGIVYAGCFYCLTDPTYPTERVSLILKTLEAEVMIVNGKTLKNAEKIGFEGEIIDIAELISEENAVIDSDVLEKIRHQAMDIDPLYSIFTSGSTGVPKGVLVNHRSTIDFIECFTEEFGITADDVIGNQAPFDFDVSVKDIYSTLKTGATLQIIPKMMFSFPTKLLDFLDDREVTTLIWAVSALCIVTTLNGFTYKVPRHLNKIMFSGEVMPVKHLNKWRNEYPDAMFVNLYGPTEITCNCTFYKIDREFGLEEKLPMGKAFDNEKVFLLDDDDNLVDESKPGQLGEICVSGTCVSMGYINNAEKTAQVFVWNPLNTKYPEIIYRTGDLGYYDDKGELFFSARKDFQIKHMGHRIELEEIETSMNAIDGLERSCCIFDEEKNRIIGFYKGDIEKKEVVRALKEKIPVWMIPTVMVSVEEMPLTKNGKIDRNKLMESIREV